MHMKFFAHNIQPVRSDILTSFRDLGNWGFIIFVSVASHKAYLEWLANLLTYFNFTGKLHIKFIHYIQGTSLIIYTFINYSSTCQWKLCLLFYGEIILQSTYCSCSILKTRQFAGKTKLDLISVRTIPNKEVETISITTVILILHSILNNDPMILKTPLLHFNYTHSCSTKLFP